MAALEPGDSLLGPTIVIRGKVTARQERLTIMGKVEGTIDHDQALTIHRDGEVDGAIRAQEVLVEGTVEGNIHGLRRVRIAPTGRVNGNVYSQLFAVDEGATIKGNVIMDADADTIEARFRSLAQSSPDGLPAKEALPARKVETRTESANAGGADDAKTAG